MGAFAEQLEAQRKALVEEIRALQEDIAQRTGRVAQLQLKLESVLQLMRLEGAAPASSERHFLEVAHDLLLERGRMHYVALAAEVRSRGVFIPGAKPDANLLAHMSRDSRFEKVARGEYAIVGTSPKVVRVSARRPAERDGRKPRPEGKNGERHGG